MSELIEFGKYKGQPLEVLQQDKQYTDWLMGQDWFRDRYSNVYALIVNNFGAPAETPEHNAMQALFLDDDLCKKFAWVVNSKRTKRNERFNDIKLMEVIEKSFENQGADVAFSVFVKLEDERWGDSFPFRIELKPQMGDDYPAVLRQIQANKCRFVVYKKYTGTGVSEKQMKAIFIASNALALSVDEFSQLDTTHTPQSAATYSAQTSP